MNGVASALARNGRSRLTVADVVGSAGVSRRTFYEHFDNLQDAVLATHDAAALALLSLIALRCERQQRWEAQVRDGLSTALEFAATEPHLAGVLVLDSFTFDAALGERVIATKERFASLLRPGRELHRPPVLPDITEMFLVSAVASILGPRIRNAEPEALRHLEPHLLELMLLPYLGRAEAARIARGSN